MDGAVFDLRGRNAVVTGAGHGIGAAIARTFARAGAGVVVADLDGSRAEAVVAEIHALGGEARAVITDVTDPASCQRAIDHAVRELGSCDVLVNNAGIYPRASLQEVTPELFRRILDVNLLGLTSMSQAAVGAMEATGTGGSIVNITSFDAVMTTLPTLYAYGSSKAAVVGATNHMARELGPLGIRVNAVAPGTTMTRTAEEMAEAGEVVDDATAQQMADTFGRVPLQRFAEPHEIASVALFLASSAASYVTGVTILADGGLHLV